MQLAGEREQNARQHRCRDPPSRRAPRRPYSRSPRTAAQVRQRVEHLAAAASLSQPGHVPSRSPALPRGRGGAQRWTKAVTPSPSAGATSSSGRGSWRPSQDEVRAVDHPQPRVRRRLRQRVLGLRVVQRHREHDVPPADAPPPRAAAAPVDDDVRLPPRTPHSTPRRPTLRSTQMPSSERAHAIVRGAPCRACGASLAVGAPRRRSRPRGRRQTRGAVLRGERTIVGSRAAAAGFGFAPDLASCAQMANAFVPGAARAGVSGGGGGGGASASGGMSDNSFIAQRRRRFTPRWRGERRDQQPGVQRRRQRNYERDDSSLCAGHRARFTI